MNNEAAHQRSPVFGVVAEGPADFAVLRHVLAGYFNDNDIVVNQVQHKPNTLGGWAEVLRFLGSDAFLEPFEFNSHLVIHIDTDRCEEAPFNIPKRDGTGRVLEVDEVVAVVQQRLISEIRSDRFGVVAHRILFAIAVDSTECWLLPLYWNDLRRAKSTNCLRSLNEKLSTVEGFSIDVSKKEARYYVRISKPLSKSKILREKAPQNPSFKIVLDNLDRMFREPPSGLATG